MWFKRVDIGEIRKAKSALPHYFAILGGEEEPNFSHAGKVSVEFDENSSLEKLWRIHEEGMRLLREGKFEENPEKSLLDLKALIAKRILKECRLCEIKCGVNREEDIGYCRVRESLIASDFLHLGEEPELVPSYTIFFSGCNFRCIFCQNWDISQQRVGVRHSPEDLGIKIGVAYAKGAKNVNFVGGEPTPNLPFILETLRHVKVHIPVLWNSNMYMSEDAMRLLDGVVDVYLGDFKWGNDECALKYSKVPHYWETVTRNFLLAKRHYRAEFLIRHLVVPNHLKCCTRPVLRWISENLGKDVRMNIMFQYHPDYKAGGRKELNRTLNYEEMLRAVKLVGEFGFKNAMVG